MQVAIDEEEAFPVYSVETNVDAFGDWQRLVDLPEDTVVRIRNAEAEFDACQRILAEAYKMAEAASNEARK